jgi:hypothetical protein
MELSGQLDTPTALPEGKEPPGSVGRKLGEPEPVWTLRTREISLTCVGYLTQIPQLPSL